MSRTTLWLLLAALAVASVGAVAHGQSGPEASLGDPVVDRQSILEAKVSCARPSGSCRGSLILYRAGNPSDDAGSIAFDIAAGGSSTLKFDIGGMLDQRLRSDGKVGFDLHTYADGQPTTVTGERRLQVATAPSGPGGSRTRPPQDGVAMPAASAAVEALNPRAPPPRNRLQGPLSEVMY